MPIGSPSLLIWSVLPERRREHRPKIDTDRQRVKEQRHSMLRCWLWCSAYVITTAILFLVRWFEWEKSPRGSRAWILGPHLAILLEGVVEPLRFWSLAGGVSPWAWAWAWALMLGNPATCPCFLSVDAMWQAGHLILLPCFPCLPLCLLCHDSLYPSGAAK